MIVKERMSHPVKTVGQDDSVIEALRRMEKEHLNRFPVVDKHGRMIGIVSKNDLLKASPSHATTLSQWEITTMLEKIKVKSVMTEDPLVVDEETVVEEAARIMVDNDVNGLPVMRGDELVGIITDGNIFEILMEMLGARNAGLRVSMLIDEREGMLYYLTKAIFEAGGNIVSMSTFLGESTTTREVVIKVSGVEQETLLAALTPFVRTILHVHQITI